MSTIRLDDQAPNERQTSLKLLQELPTRSQRRYVYAVMASKAPKDEPLKEAILILAAGGQREWTLPEWMELTWRVSQDDSTVRAFSAKHARELS